MQSQTLLIVDDEEFVIEVIREVAESIGLRALDVRTGREALAMVATEKPDIILCDLHLPDFDGHALCRSIRETCPDAQLLLMTGEIGAEGGACGSVLKKPFGIADLQLALSRVVKSVASENLPQPDTKINVKCDSRHEG